jgi:phosphoribosylformylglycinamidine synthase
MANQDPQPEGTTAIPIPATITPALLKTHSITDEEYASIEQKLGRTPSLTELGIFSVMWSEHCSYKSSRVHLRRLPTKGTRLSGPGSVVQGPGENAGIIDVGDGWACAFKIESHNHPSYIEPYQGAATGVGGILRDIFTMGARPLAVMDSLRFGPLSPGSRSEDKEPRTRNQELSTIDYRKNAHIMTGVVHGVGGYGNCFGVPNLGGETRFEDCYSGNPLLNAFALGLVRTDEIFYAKAEGVGNPVFYVGAKTGRDGIHGATMASEEFTAGSEQKRPNVQMGDPFLEKLLLEACLEVMKTGAVLGIQDMGAAGLTCSTCEMGARGNLGVTIELDKVPQRETGMTSYEIMLSESQERMLLVAEKGREAEVLAVFAKWGLDCAEVGTVTADDVMRVYHHGVLQAEIPNKALTDEAPVYHRPVGVWNPPVPRDPPAWVLEELKKPRDYTADLKKLLASPNICSKRWIYEQYDSMVQTNTVQGPGGEAGVIRIKPYESSRDEGSQSSVPSFQDKQTTKNQELTTAPKPERGLAMALAGNGRWCYLDPKLGAMHAVAEAARKVACTGATPVAATNCLNFGNPQKPEIMAQLSEAIDGIAEACTALGTPVTGGNVSLYNETLGEGIYPTPVIGIVGILDDVTKAVPSAFQRIGDAICVLFPRYSEFTFPPMDPTRKDWGQLRKELAQQEAEMEHAHLRRFGSSEYAKVLYGELWGDVPTIDLEASARCNQVLQELASLRLLNSAADEGSGGSVVTITRCALPNNIGADLELFYEPPGPLELLSLFREDVNHVVITCSPEDVDRIDAITRVRGIGCQQIGTTIPDEIKVGFADVPLVWQLGDLRRSSEDALAEQLAQEVIA